MHDNMFWVVEFVEVKEAPTIREAKKHLFAWV